MKKNGSIFIQRGEAARTRALATLKEGGGVRERWVVGCFGSVVGTVASVYLRVYCLCLAFNLTMPKTYDCAPSGDLQLSTLLALSVRRTDPPPLAFCLSVCLPVCVVCCLCARFSNFEAYF